MVLSERLNKEMRVIVMAGIVMLLMTIMPSSVNSKDEPVCWQKMYECISGALRLQPLTSFDWCCPEIKAQMAADLPCFCSTEDVIVNRSLKDCKLGSNFDKLCKDVNKSGSGSNSSEAGKPPDTEMVKNSATNVGLLVGLVSASASLFAGIMIIF